MTQYHNILCPHNVRDSIESSISRYDIELLIDILRAETQHSTSSILVLKYISTRYCTAYHPGNGACASRMHISNTPGYTWGPGNYIVPLSYPISTAIYGRAGIVAQLDESLVRKWRIFDATDTWNTKLYKQWAQAQPDYDMLMLTCHSQLGNHHLRKRFKELFRIDCVIFHPDQKNKYYTSDTDVWLCISEWDGNGALRTGYSRILRHPRLSIIVSEEFVPIGHDVTRRTLINPWPRITHGPNLAAQIRHAYNSRTPMEYPS